MILTNLKIVLNTIKQNKVFYGLNVLSLSTAIGCFILLLTYISWEKSYDSWIKNSKNIFRVHMEAKLGNDELRLATMPTALGPTLKSVYPEVKYTARISKSEIKEVRLGNEPPVSVSNVMYADSTFFEVFSLPTTAGSGKTCLNEPYSVAISETAARNIFGIAEFSEVLNKTIRLGQFEDLYKITCVFKDVPANTHFHAHLVVSINSLERSKRDTWTEWDYYTYGVIDDNNSFADLERKINAEVLNNYYAPALERETGKSMRDILSGGNSLKFVVQPITEIHLHSNLKSELESNGSASYVQLFLILAIFVIVIAVLNFLNFSTASYSRRAKEVGITKVLGATRRQLIAKFITESMVIVFSAVILGLSISFVTLPYFNSIVGRNLQIVSFFGWWLPAIFSVLTIMLGVFAGFYPAIYLSSISPVKAIKGLNTPKSAGLGSIRMISILFQVCTAFILVAGTLIIYKQLNYINNKDLGFDRNNVVVINTRSLHGGTLTAFANELGNSREITDWSITGYFPVKRELDAINNAFTDENTNDIKVINWWYVDNGYLPTFGIRLLQGRNFHETTDAQSVILNETAVREFGLSDPVGRRIGISGDNSEDIRWYTIVGVVEDFHFTSLHDKIGSLALVNGLTPVGLAVKLNTNDIKGTIEFVEQKWKSFAPGVTFDFFFLDEKLRAMYEDDTRLGRAFTLFAALAIITACLALYSSSVHMSTSMAKEVSIRKALGATSLQIALSMLLKVSRTVLLAVAAGVPILHYIVNHWIENFAYRQNTDVSIYVASFSIILLLSLAASVYSTYKLATGNPIDSLRT